MSQAQARFVRNAIATRPELEKSCKRIVQELLADPEDTDADVHPPTKAEAAWDARDGGRGVPSLGVCVHELVAMLENGPNLDTEDDRQATICLGAMLE